MKQTESILTKRNIKPTAMRELVLKVLTEQKAAISLFELENKFERADRSTLYRTLKTFEENKLIHSINDGSGSVKYALCHDSCECNTEDLHVHFLCKKCKQTFCLHEISIPAIIIPSQFVLEDVNVILKGICANCKK
ncbi:MAG: Fur family transcriptional regulator [Bacteroidales bacterium]|jgi:Fur family ferric uptake transcriptional regulator|nr:Fur family transcriptional regulator [Bacteroidales bacterium]